MAKFKIKFPKTGQIINHIDTNDSNVCKLAEAHAIHSNQVVQIIRLCPKCDRPVLPKSHICITCDIPNERIN